MAHIRIVDDRAINRTLLITLPGYVGHTLAQAADGVEALDILFARGACAGRAGAPLPERDSA